jgi:hypothetical protein
MDNTTNKKQFSWLRILGALVIVWVLCGIVFAVIFWNEARLDASADVTALEAAQIILLGPLPLFVLFGS